MNTLKVKGVSLTVDGQDGGYGITIYNNKEEMLADFRSHTPEEECSDEEFLQEDDGYQNGYIDMNVTIEIDLDTGKLVRPIHMHAGQ